MMRDPLPTNDNIVRYVGFAQLDEEVQVTSRAYSLDPKKQGVVGYCG